ncbi:MAG: dephospho-CoA kinase, partial [Actinomycetia bacterium]|nr:dephospho-CoA kinase [Actinomycetes bacterium]
MGTRVALTGGIAAGKSMVAARMGELGAILVDSDVLARQVVEPGTDGLAAVVARFGRGVLRDDGTLDRAALGALVFTDPGARADLEAITHPRVRAARQAILDGAAPDAVVVAVIPLLVETGQQGAYDQVVVVDVPEAVQVARLVARDGLTTEQAWARLHAQAPREARLG